LKIPYKILLFIPLDYQGEYKKRIGTVFCIDRRPYFVGKKRVYMAIFEV